MNRPLARHVLTPALLALSCRAGGDAPPPTVARSEQTAPVSARSVRIPAADAPDAGPIETDDTLGRPTATHTDIVYAPPWVVLGQNVVDTRNGRRVRTVPFGDVVIAEDRVHLAAFDGRVVVFGAIADAKDDYRVPALLDNLAGTTLSNDGATALWVDEKGAVMLVDARAKTRTVLWRPGADAGPPDDVRAPRHAMATTGRRVTWLEGSRARMRDLDTDRTLDASVNGKPASATEIAGDTWVASFGDELVVTRISSGVELARKTKTGNFMLADDGKTVAWEDARAKLQTLVLFDVEQAREVNRVVVEDDPDTKARRRFGGACGGGTFSLLPTTSTLKGNVATLERDCSLYDEVKVDLATGKVGTFTSVTPAADYEEQLRDQAVCKRAQVKCEERSDVAWIPGQVHVVMRDKSGKLALFQAATGRRLAPLEDAGDTKMDVDFRVALDGKTIAAIEESGAAHLWDAATGKTLWKGPATAP